jgi:hypothetical protein
MELTDKTKILILVAIIGVVIFFFLQNRVNDDEGTKNEGALTQDQNKTSDDTMDVPEQDDDKKILKQAVAEVLSEDTPKLEQASRAERDLPEENASVLKKFRTRNTSKDGSFLPSSYVDGKRGGSRASDLDKFFEEGHPLEEKIGFAKNETGQNIDYANYVPGKQRKLRDVDKFNAEAMLPKEKNKDWFDDPYESTSVKNTHLINIYRPIGINSIQTTLKNASHDLRSAPIAPKFVISPFLNSSYEPDTNLRNQSLCY